MGKETIIINVTGMLIEIFEMKSRPKRYRNLVCWACSNLFSPLEISGITLKVLHSTETSVYVTIILQERVGYNMHGR